MEAHILHIVLRIIAVASVIHILLPPFETFNGFPRLQKYYTLFVAIVAWVALNARGQLIKVYGVDTGKPAQSGRQ